MGKGSILLKRALLEMQKKIPDLNKTFELLNKSANQNNFEAIYAIGTWYLHGKFVKKNPSLAIDYFKKAIQGNISSAYFDLAVCYETGIGIKKNYKLAFQHYLNAALLGDKPSVYEIGRCYYHGIGISKNIKIALIWLNHAESKNIVNK